MSNINEMDLSFIFKALSDYNRLKIILKLIDGEKCANTLLQDFYITQPTLSHHMAILKENGLVNVRKMVKNSTIPLIITAFLEIKQFVALFY